MKFIVQGFAGAPLETLYNTPNYDEAEFPLGTRAFTVNEPAATSEDFPIMGTGGEFIYCKLAANLSPGMLVTFDNTTFRAASEGGVAGTGRPIAISTADQGGSEAYGWVQVAGVAPAWVSGAFTANAPVYDAAWGNITTTAAAGKQILRAKSISFTASFTRQIRITAGSRWVEVLDDEAGIFPYLIISGTGIPANTWVKEVIGKRFKTDANATASGIITGTFALGKMGLMHINHPYAQGQIT